MPRQELRRGSDARERIVDAIIGARVSTDRLPDRRHVKRFLAQYFAHVPYEDLAGRSEPIMARAALDHLEFGKTRRRGTALLRVFNATEEKNGYVSAFTFIEMVNDDMPFLVDSVVAAVARQDIAVHITVHPVIRVSRDGRGRITGVPSASDKKASRESWIRIAIDKLIDQEEIDALEAGIHRVLDDVRRAVDDWAPMRTHMRSALDELLATDNGGSPDLKDESAAMLEWLIDDHFTFLGYRRYRLTGRGDKLNLTAIPESGLGLMSNPDHGAKRVALTPEMRRVARNRDWMLITKANSRSTVHRHAYLDYIGIKIFDKSGEVTGEHRFIGLFTAVAYSESSRNIPLLRQKIGEVVARARIEPSGHRGKALLHILDTFPRDELFQASISDLARTTLGVLNLQDRQRVRFFIRRDVFRRFFSCLVYVPKEKYTTAVRRRIEGILLDAFAGTSIESSVQIADSALARVHIIVRTEDRERPPISIQTIEKQIADVVVTWTDKLKAQLAITCGEGEGLKLYRQYGSVFPLGYQEDTLPRDACTDVARIEDMRRDGLTRTVNLYRPPDAGPGDMHFLIYTDDELLPLSEALPVIEAMGVEVYTERPYELRLDDGSPFWIQDFHLHLDEDADIDVESVAERFETCFMRVLSGEAESDGLNRLILYAGLDWRQTALLRCYARYLLQLGLPFSQAYMENVLVAHARTTAKLVRQFELQFDPALSQAKRKRELKTHLASVEKGLKRARNVDEDRILNAFAGAIRHTLRTNYFVVDADGAARETIAIKLDSGAIPEAPKPRPMFEIFVYSTEVEGVHLRGGRIARGGLRWSDRREDFRTEILGLMKAQVVKNTVIVPTGAKGGFVCKNLPTGDRDAVLSKGIECYRAFIASLLDVTDNVIDGKVVTPGRIVRRDEEDPYLVVAADKGTATFSDIANEISESYGFWLGDAFASGGSAGYDHKKMGITARGAWEAVKRHFREQGINTQKDLFTVAGIGDMSGDVFGNGMLLSKKIQLVAAFNHLHIFIDPTPDAAASYRERKRLFAKGRSSWTDYDETQISKGGGIFSRQAKTIRLSREMRKLLDTDAAAMQPDELIRAILKMRVNLLWNGGIGTYIKASSESHADVGDRSNDSVRVDANEVRCDVIGEGGNLGLTQYARIEFSLNGGRVNTDFIDNSAGVDSSDREVNIKILLSDVAKAKGMSRKKRNELLAAMTEDVAELVLRNNYLQTQAISMSEIRSLERIDETARVITSLERSGLLDRGLECLPDDVEIEERKARRQGVTRPELAVVLSYAKIDLYNGLIASGESLEDFLAMHPMRYFPEVLRRRYADFLPTHRLSPQILATLIANDLVNRMGPAFVRRVQLDTGVGVCAIARAYTVARQICRAGALNRVIQSLDYEIPAAAQMTLLFEVARTQRHATYWLIERYGERIEIAPAVERLGEGMTIMYTRTAGVQSSAARTRHHNAVKRYVEMGVPEGLADKMAALLLTRAALDIADLAAEYKRDVVETARLYSAFNESLGLFWLHVGAEDLSIEGRWQAVARSNLRDGFYRIRRQLAEELLKKRSRKSMPERVETWLADRAPRVDRIKAMIEEMKLRGDADFATLSVAAQELKDLLSDPG